MLSKIQCLKKGTSIYLRILKERTIRKRNKIDKKIWKNQLAQDMKMREMELDQIKKQNILNNFIKKM